MYVDYINDITYIVNTCYVYVYTYTYTYVCIYIYIYVSSVDACFADAVKDGGGN